MSEERAEKNIWIYERKMKKNDRNVIIKNLMNCVPFQNFRFCRMKDG
jgi:hypothetical protein